MYTSIGVLSGTVDATDATCWQQTRCASKDARQTADHAVDAQKVALQGVLHPVAGITVRVQPRKVAHHQHATVALADPELHAAAHSPSGRRCRACAPAAELWLKTREGLQ